jgi:GNAT superfamily N-acetyltransferase
MTPGMTPMIRKLDAAAAKAEIAALAEVLKDCVDDGAAVNFLTPFSEAQARAFWERAIAEIAAGKAVLLVADHDGRLAGTVMLGLDTPPNQPHRADVKKMLVHRRARRRGLARALLLAIEAEARGLGRTLLTLDTRQGDNAEPLYQGMGYVLVGVVPGYSLASAGGLDAAAFYYKQLD